MKTRTWITVSLAVITFLAGLAGASMTVMLLFFAANCMMFGANMALDFGRNWE